MKIAFTSKQLTADLLAGILNQAFIKSDVNQCSKGIEHVTFEINNVKCIMAVQGDTLQLSHTIRVESNATKELILKVVNHINCKIMHAKYAGSLDDGTHLISHHYAHWIPEDETITPAYIVKLARSFMGFQEKHLSQWVSNAYKALG